jgi:hypothetical protein
MRLKISGSSSWIDLSQPMRGIWTLMDLAAILLREEDPVRANLCETRSIFQLMLLLFWNDSASKIKTALCLDSQSYEPSMFFRLIRVVAWQ